MPEPTESTLESNTQKQKHQRFLNMIRQWAEGTVTLRELMARDYAFVNGRQTTNELRHKVKTETGRELLYFNEIRPQFELLSGHRTSQTLDYIAAPRNREDKRYSTIVSSLLKATFDVAKKNQHTRRVGDDGDACGLGALEIGHTFDYAEDVVWGDIFFERISPFGFVFDIWGTSPQFQDGMFMGKRIWVHEDKYKEDHGSDVTIPSHGEDWITILSSRFEEMSDAFSRELIISEKKHVAVFTLYYKVPMDLWIVADSETGDVYDGGSTKESAEKKKQESLKSQVNDQMTGFAITPMGDGETVVWLITDESGNPMLDETTGAPAQYPQEEHAQAFLDGKRKELEGIMGQNWKIFKRKRMRIKWVEFSAFDILDEGELTETTQKFPFRVYISRHIGDDIDDIEGITRQVIDRQKEITKRYNHLADHLAHSAHSGFFNRKGEGANTKQLQLMGARPGIVVEYSTTMPTKIEPSQIPSGHFALLDSNIGGMQRGTGMNAEMLGFTSTSTVSGDAIEARQSGGMMMQMSRLTNYQEFEKEVAEQSLYQIQVSMPVDKMRRILGVWEAKNQQRITGVSVYLDPITGESVSETQLMSLLANVKNTKFDLLLKPTPVDQSTRERQFMQAMQAMQLVTQTGRPIGSTTLEQLLNMSDLSEMFAASLIADAQKAEQAMLAEQQMAQIGEAIKGQQSREGPNG